MFDQLFRYPVVVRRHHDGPLATERAAYLASCAAQGSAPGTLLKCARYCLAIAHVLQAMPHDQSFTTADIDVLAGVWAAGRVEDRHAAATRWPHQHFRAIATDFLKSLGRWTPHRLRRVRTSVRLTILSPPSSRTDYGPQAHAVFDDGRSSGSCLISSSETASWRPSPLIIWTPTSSMPLSDGAVYHCDRRRFACAVGSATVKPKAGSDKAWRRRSWCLAFIAMKAFRSGRHGRTSLA